MEKDITSATEYKIGHTTYIVNLVFNTDSSENISDIVILIPNRSCPIGSVCCTHTILCCFAAQNPSHAFPYAACSGYENHVSHDFQMGIV